MNVQERQAADEKIADLAASILAAERLDLGRQPAPVEASLALLDLVRLLAKQASFTDRLRIAVALRRASLLMLKSLVWH
jgi:hypothetical protein